MRRSKEMIVTTGWRKSMLCVQKLYMYVPLLEKSVILLYRRETEDVTWLNVLTWPNVCVMHKFSVCLSHSSTSFSKCHKKGKWCYKLFSTLNNILRSQVTYMHNDLNIFTDCPTWCVQY